MMIFSMTMPTTQRLMTRQTMTRATQCAEPVRRCMSDPDVPPSHVGVRGCVSGSGAPYTYLLCGVVAETALSRQDPRYTSAPRCALSGV